MNAAEVMTVVLAGTLAALGPALLLWSIFGEICDSRNDRHTKP